MVSAVVTAPCPYKLNTNWDSVNHDIPTWLANVLGGKGKIIVDGIELTNDIRQIDKIRAEVGMVFQSFNLFPHLSVARNIMLAPSLVKKTDKAAAEAQARKLLERVGLKKPAHLIGAYGSLQNWQERVSRMPTILSKRFERRQKNPRAVGAAPRTQAKDQSNLTEETNDAKQKS